MQPENLSSNPEQGTHTGRDASVTGQPLRSPAVAGRAGAAAAALGASTQSADEPSSMQLDDDQPGQPVEPAAQKALPAALMVMFKKNSVVNLQDVRSVCICCCSTACLLSMVKNHALVHLVCNVSYHMMCTLIRLMQLPHLLQ